MAAQISEVELAVRRKNRAAEERKAADHRAVERDKRGEAERMRALAASARTAPLARIRLTDATRLELEAERAASEAERAEAKAAVLARDERAFADRVAAAGPSRALAAPNDSEWTFI